MQNILRGLLFNRGLLLRNTLYPKNFQKNFEGNLHGYMSKFDAHDLNFYSPLGHHLGGDHRVVSPIFCVRICLFLAF
eukprot:UN27906